jgi:hypothetical protein
MSLLPFHGLDWLRKLKYKRNTGFMSKSYNIPASVIHSSSCCLIFAHAKDRVENFGSPGMVSADITVENDSSFFACVKVVANLRLRKPGLIFAA